MCKPRHLHSVYTLYLLRSEANCIHAHMRAGLILQCHHSDVSLLHCAYTVTGKFISPQINFPTGLESDVTRQHHQQHEPACFCVHGTRQPEMGHLSWTRIPTGIDLPISCGIPEGKPAQVAHHGLHNLIKRDRNLYRDWSKVHSAHLQVALAQ